MMEHLAHCDSEAQMSVGLNTNLRIDKYKLPPVTYIMQYYRQNWKEYILIN
jgi:hypothetical protein